MPQSARNSSPFLFIQGNSPVKGIANYLVIAANITFSRNSDLIGRVAIFCVVLNLLDRVRHENRIDILRAVKDIRDARSGMIRNKVSCIYMRT